MDGGLFQVICACAAERSTSGRRWDSRLLWWIRPCRESQTGWTPAAAMRPGNHSFMALNERSPALKVFWSRRWRDGRRDGERARLPKRARVINERLTNKTEPEGAGQETSGPLLSVPKLVQPARSSPRHALDP